MPPSRKPQVLIRTLPLSAGNYGGILQAYALQQALRDLGFDAVTERSAPSSPQVTTGGRLKDGTKRALSHLGIRGGRESWVAATVKHEVDAALNEFVARHILQVDQVPLSVGHAAESYSGFVSGSDQVWRARWSDVPRCLWNDIDARDSRPRLSYAASFGIDDLSEYSAEALAQSSRLAQRLTAVSVREESGVNLCKQEWGVEAERHLDPTMLVDLARYRALSDAAVIDDAAEGGVVTYILDRASRAQGAADQIAERRSTHVVHLTTPTPPSLRAYRRAKDHYRRRSVEEWLTNIAAADFVVTDSFHGTVFAILFNRPFVSIVNRSRGASRFTTLLSTFGLEHRLVEPGQGVDPALMEDDTDWVAVNATIKTERLRGITYLQKHLSVS